ncbi:hypothetical protein ACHQM5_022715 [Ranunculus cassubicifolius]
MRGVGGPLLCIGDLLTDVGEGDSGEGVEKSLASTSTTAIVPNPKDGRSATDLNHVIEIDQIFEENYKQLNEALSETGHSWTALTLKLCTALETADKLIQSANSDAKALPEKVERLQNIMRRGDAAVKSIKLVNSSKP